jgi:ceramide glucosyltransferase
MWGMSVNMATTYAAAAACFCLFFTLLNWLSIGIAAIRARPRPTPFPPPRAAPGVSIIRPLCGLDNFCEETLESSFRLDYPSYELIFCVAKANDHVLPLVRCLIARYPDQSARLIVGDEKVSLNPKLNNCVRGWDMACHDWIILADSNVLMPSDYIQRLLMSWRRRTGLVCSMPLGSRAQNLWAELECAFLNTFEARWQYCAEAMGLGFAQGKNMLWQREVMDKGGGIRSLATNITEDAAATTLVRRQGLTVNLADNPFEQPLGMRTAADVWSRQARWKRARRKTFPLLYFPEIFAGAVLPCLAAGYAALILDVSATASMVSVALVWYVPETLLALALRWHVSWRMPFFFVLRDLMLPLLYIDAWCVDHFVWRGNEMSVQDEERSLERG